MRIASFNVENMFDRAKALNGANWAEGRPALEAHKELNTLFEKPTYSAANKAKMLSLLQANGLGKSDEGPLLRLRRIRGNFIKRPRVGPPEIVAAGRADWIGWIELKTEAVNEVATQNTARVIAAVNADILAVVEAEDRTTLRLPQPPGIIGARRAIAFAFEMIHQYPQTLTTGQAYVVFSAVAAKNDAVGVGVVNMRAD